MSRFILLVSAIAGLLMFSGCQKEPQASISASTTNTKTQKQIKFFNSSTNAESFEWDFGDGTTSQTKEPVKIYSKGGNYTVKLTAFSKGRKKSNEAFLDIIINEPPNERFLGTFIMEEDLNAGFCGVGSIMYKLFIYPKGENQIVLYNLTDNLDSLYANVNGDTFIIPEQDSIYSISQGFLWDFNSGVGSISNNTITLSYNYDDIAHDPNGCGEVSGSGTGNKE